MTMHARIKAAVDRLAGAKQEYQILQYDEDSPQELRPPATPEELAALEARAGFPLPPSYRAFLELHNGWLEFSGGAMILPTSERDESWVQTRIESIRAHLLEFDDPTVLDGTFMVVLGQDEKSYAYLNPRRWDGAECEVVDADVVHGVEGRYPDFASFLEHQAEIWESIVADTK